MPKILLVHMLKRRKMTKYRFAHLMKMEYQNARRFFRPGYDPKFSMLAAWSKVLKCKIRDLYKE